MANPFRLPDEGFTAFVSRTSNDLLINRQDLENSYVRVRGILLSAKKNQYGGYEWRVFVPDLTFISLTDSLIVNHGRYVVLEEQKKELTLSVEREDEEFSTESEPRTRSAPRRLAHNFFQRLLARQHMLRAPIRNLLFPGEQTGEEYTTAARAPRQQQGDTEAEPYLADELVKAYRDTEHMPRPIVLLVSKEPGYEMNTYVLDYALGLSERLEKPDYIKHAPNKDVLSFVLQLAFLATSRHYYWSSLPYAEIEFSGILLNPSVNGKDLYPLMMRVYDAQRDVWVVVNLTAGDGHAQGILRAVGKTAPRLIWEGAKIAF